MKVGFIGCGGMGITHYQSLKVLSEGTDLEVTALADSREESLVQASELFPNAKRYNDGMELIEHENLDVVYICLPSHLHTSHAVAAMEKGCHVFVEKPVCLSFEEADQLLEVQKRTGSKVMVGQVVRFMEEYQYLKKVYDSGTLGALKSIVMQRVSGDVQWGYKDWFHNEKFSGSVVLDLHIHDVDFLRYLLGEPDSFEVQATSFASKMVNQIITTYRFGKVFVTAEGVWDVSPALKFEASFRAHFEKGTVIFKGKSDPKLVVYKADGTVEIPELEAIAEAGEERAGIQISSLGTYYLENQYFWDCLQKGQEVGIAPLKEGVESVRLALREWEAAKAYIEKNQ